MKTRNASTYRLTNLWGLKVFEEDKNTKSLSIFIRASFRNENVPGKTAVMIREGLVVAIRPCAGVRMGQMGSSGDLATRDTADDPPHELFLHRHTGF